MQVAQKAPGSSPAITYDLAARRASGGLAGPRNTMPLSQNHMSTMRLQQQSHRHPTPAVHSWQHLHTGSNRGRQLHRLPLQSSTRDASGDLSPSSFQFVSNSPGSNQPAPLPPATWPLTRPAAGTGVRSPQPPPQPGESSGSGPQGESRREAAHNNPSTSDPAPAPSSSTPISTGGIPINGAPSQGYSAAGHPNGNGRSGHGNGSSPAAGISVEEALARAQAAVQQVETSLEGIQALPSATPPNPWAGALRKIRSAAIVAAACVALVASHALGLIVQWAGAIAGGLGIAYWGYSRSSLAFSGALAAVVVGAATQGCSLRMSATLLAFFFSSSKLTHFKEEFKSGLDDAAKSGGQRDWRQVLCNAGIPTMLAIAYGVLAGCVDVPLGPLPQVDAWRAQLMTLLAGAFLGYYACCCGDTWASELGPLSSDTPRLITTLRPVRRGTNGGVTLLGLAASVLGGTFIGLVFYAAALVSPTMWIVDSRNQMAAALQWRLIPLGLMAGLFGSILDSVLGATLQYTGYNRVTERVTSKPGPDVTHISGLPFLDNNLVNLVSATLTSALTGLAALRVFW